MRFAGRALYGSLALLVLIAVHPSARAEPPVLDFPAACTPGRDCWVFQYFDHEPGPASRDYACGTRSYNDHNGTDIALRDVAAILNNVPVLAAAPGQVRNIRDGMDDTRYVPDRSGPVEGRECGNGVAIAHGDGWETQYCHMRKGSVRVRPGEAVRAGHVLGHIGNSGKAEFPHLHLSVRHNGRPVDPFVGPGSPMTCGISGGRLWSDRALDRLRYSPVDILGAGFAPTRPLPEDAYAGRLNADALPFDAPALIAWTVIVGVHKGDRLSIQVLGPDGATLVDNRTVIDRDRIRYFAYAGGRRPGERWPAGEYRASVRLERAEGPQQLTRDTERIVSVR